jgi:ABC-type dipeptide/oligopeptide/nickel transport system permease component
VGAAPANADDDRLRFVSASVAPWQPARPARNGKHRGFVLFVLRRLGIGVLQLLGVTVVAFLVVAVVPGDPAAANLGQSALGDPSIVAAYRHHYGLDKPLPVQYGLYLWHLVHGDFGLSQLTQRPVSDDLRQYFPATVELALAAIVIALVFGVALGMVGALYQNRLPDRLVRFVTLFGISLPSFWLGLVAFYFFFFKFGWLPGEGRLSPALNPPTSITGLYTVDSLLTGNWTDLWDSIRHLVLPACVLACYTISFVARFSRAAILEVLSRDYVQAARAKGLPERVVILRHVMRPASPAIVTIAGLAFGGLLSGAVLVEQVFSWPGLGQYAYRSSTSLNLPGIAGVSIVIAAVYIVVNLVTDLLYVAIDPRISFQ